MKSRFSPTILRLLGGVALITSSAIGMTALVASLNQSHGIVMAARDLPVGHTLTTSDLALAEGFLSGDVVAPVTTVSAAIGSVTTRPLAQGELISPAVVSTRADSRLTTLVVTLAAPVPEAMVSGATIELWTTGHRSATTSFMSETPIAEPRALVAGEYVGPAGSPESIAVDSQPRAEIIIAKADVATVLAAQASADDLVIMPAWSSR